MKLEKLNSLLQYLFTLGAIILAFFGLLAAIYYLIPLPVIITGVVIILVLSISYGVYLARKESLEYESHLNDHHNTDED